jgi:hypothetical protein
MIDHLPFKLSNMILGWTRLVRNSMLLNPRIDTFAATACMTSAVPITSFGIDKRRARECLGIPAASATYAGSG